MEESGFVCYPSEWWHWSYGDKYWAFLTNNESALYSPVDEKDITAHI
jgi:zinc D-Ala-D-Ala dipeptidase